MPNSHIKKTSVKKISIAKGAYLKGPKHTHGGIKVFDKSGSTQPVAEVEGEEIVITAPASSDTKLHEFEGKQMTKRQILSAINQDAGGISLLEKGGRIKKKITVRYSKKQYKYGGEMRDAKDIVSDCGCQHGKMEKGGKVEKEWEAIYMYRENGDLISKGVPINATSQSAAIKKAKEYGKSNGWRYTGIRYPQENEMEKGGKMGEGDIIQSDKELAEKYHMVQSLQPIVVPDIAIGKPEAEKIYNQLDSVVNMLDNRKINFVLSVFGKLSGHAQHNLIFKIIPDLQEVTKEALPIYFEPERNKKKHTNIIGFHNYLNIVRIAGNLYYVRITAQEKTKERKKSKRTHSAEIHNLFISDIQIQKAGDNVHSGISTPANIYYHRPIQKVEDVTVFPESFSPTTNTYPQPPIDTKLQNWFQKAKEASLKFESGGQISNLPDIKTELAQGGTLDRRSRDYKLLDANVEFERPSGTMEKGGAIKYDKSGNMIGDGSFHSNYKVEEFKDYPEIIATVSKSDNTESVYVTYKNVQNDKSITIRFSDHENNATKFGDQLNGYTATENEILYHLGFKGREFVPNKKLSIWFKTVARKDAESYQEADKTIQELYSLGANADISEYKGKLAKGSRYLILGDKVDEEKESRLGPLGDKVYLGRYIYTDNVQLDRPSFAKGGKLSDIIAANPDRIMLVRSTPSTSLKYYKGPDYKYANAFDLNKAIEELLDSHPEFGSADFTTEEKSLLQYYSGYGGLEKFGAEGKGLLYEYFTPALIAEKMWGLAYQYGFDGGDVLEPSCGIGEFIKYAPNKNQVTGYEINPYSARICTILYPGIKMYQQYFEEIFLINRNTIKNKVSGLKKYQLVIGNPPYGEFLGKFAGMGEKQYTRAGNYIDYFIFRGLDLLKTGGLLIFIVGAEVAAGGKPFLQQQMNACKKEIAEKSDLLDAYRLPNGVFERTDVLTDIMVLRKK